MRKPRSITRYSPSLALAAVTIVTILALGHFALAQAQVVTPNWIFTGSLHTPRSDYTATLLPNGKVLVAGGKPDPACPAPTVAEGGQCVLRGDAVLAETLRLPSDTKLNCKGHLLRPAATGMIDNPRTIVNEFQPSRPELAILLHRAYDTKIQNCRIEGFDFGILVAETKAPEGESETRKAQNKILANTIDVRTNAISLLKSDGALIADNQLTYAAERGRGIVIEFDSDGRPSTYSRLPGHTG